MTPAEPGVTSYATPTDTQVVVTRVVRASRELAFDSRGEAAGTGGLHRTMGTGVARDR
jgi:hypothetical protein